MSKIGYNNCYDHVLEEKSSYTDFSGSRADKEFWIVEHSEVEKEFLKKKAHQKSLASVTQSLG